MPAAGYRHTLTGAVGGVGGEGLCWSSSSFGGSGNSYAACYLDFLSVRLDPLNATKRSYGLSVRCVQHLRGIVSDACAPANYPIKNAPLTLNGGGYGFCQCGR